MGLGGNITVMLSPNGKHLFCAGFHDDPTIDANQRTLWFGYIENFTLVEPTDGATVGTVGGKTLQENLIIRGIEYSVPGPPTSSFTLTETMRAPPEPTVSGSCYFPAYTGGIPSPVFEVCAEGQQYDGGYTTDITLNYGTLPNTDLWDIAFGGTKIFSINGYSWILYDNKDGSMKADYVGLYQTTGYGRCYITQTSSSEDTASSSPGCQCCNGPHCTGDESTYTCAGTGSVNAETTDIGPPSNFVGTYIEDFASTGSGHIATVCSSIDDTPCDGDIDCGSGGSSTTTTPVTGGPLVRIYNGLQIDASSIGFGGGGLADNYYGINSDTLAGIFVYEDVFGSQSHSFIRQYESQHRTSESIVTKDGSGGGVTIFYDVLTWAVADTLILSLLNAPFIGAFGGFRTGYRGNTNNSPDNGAVLISSVIEAGPGPEPVFYKFSPYLVNSATLTPETTVTAFDDIHTYYTLPSSSVTTAKSISRTVVESAYIDITTFDIILNRWTLGENGLVKGPNIKGKPLGALGSGTILDYSTLMGSA